MFDDPACRLKMETDPSYAYYGMKSAEDIIYKWGAGAREGTAMHAAFEDLTNLVAYEMDRPAGDSSLTADYKVTNPRSEYIFFDEFCVRMGVRSGEREFYRTEMLMFDDRLHISGMADTFLYDKKTGGYIITDFKRMKGGLPSDPAKPRKPIESLAANSRGQNLPAFECLRNHSGNKYGCQLTLYKRLFEYMYPDRKVVGMFLVVIDSSKLDGDALQIHEVPMGKYETCIDQAFGQRALDILIHGGDSLPSALCEQLEILVQAINFSNMSLKRQRDI